MRNLNKKADDNPGGLGFGIVIILMLVVLAILLIFVAPKVWDNLTAANKCVTSKGDCLSGQGICEEKGLQSLGQKDCKEGYECCQKDIMDS
jgi:competence protein ComGC